MKNDQGEIPPGLFWSALSVTVVSMVLLYHGRPDPKVFSPSWGQGQVATPPQSFQTDRLFRWTELDGRKAEIRFAFTTEQREAALTSFGVPALRRQNTAFLMGGGFKVVRWGHHVDRGSGKLIEQVQLRIDYESVYQKSIETVKIYARQLYEHFFGSPEFDPLRSFLGFVQQIPYKQPPQIFNKRYINGYFVPLLCLSEGYGDCDTKAVLLADLLSAANEQEGRLGLALIEGRGVAHTVLLVQRPQLPGMSSIYADKFGRYLPVETTAPGWQPGFLSPILIDLLKEGRFRFVPF